MNLYFTRYYTNKFGGCNNEYYIAENKEQVLNHIINNCDAKIEPPSPNTCYFEDIRLEEENIQLPFKVKGC